MAGKTHTYRVDVEWTGNDGQGAKSYTSYRRDHVIRTEGNPDILGSSDPNFRGDPARWNPEELLVASLSACHKLWCLHLCSVAGLVVQTYIDRAEGVMEETPDGSGRFVACRPAPGHRDQRRRPLQDRRHPPRSPQEVLHRQLGELPGDGGRAAIRVAARFAMWPLAIAIDPVREPSLDALTRPLRGAVGAHPGLTSTTDAETGEVILGGDSEVVLPAWPSAPVREVVGANRRRQVAYRGDHHADGPRSTTHKKRDRRHGRVCTGQDRARTRRSRFGVSVPFNGRRRRHVPGGLHPRRSPGSGGG